MTKTITAVDLFCMKTSEYLSKYRAIPILLPAVTKKPLANWWQRPRYIFLPKSFIFLVRTPLQRCDEIGMFIVEKNDLHPVMFTTIHKFKQIIIWILCQSEKPLEK